MDLHVARSMVRSSFNESKLCLSSPKLSIVSLAKSKQSHCLVIGLANVPNYLSQVSTSSLAHFGTVLFLHRTVASLELPTVSWWYKWLWSWIQSDHRVSFDGAPDELRQCGGGVDWWAVLAPAGLVIYGKIYQPLSMLEWLIVTGGRLGGHSYTVHGGHYLDNSWWPSLNKTRSSRAVPIPGISSRAFKV